MLLERVGSAPKWRSNLRASALSKITLTLFDRRVARALISRRVRRLRVIVRKAYPRMEGSRHSGSFADYAIGN